jgi:hypothetical protein
MSMVCPQCNGTFEQRLQCPTCNVRLLYQATRSSGRVGLPGAPGQWQHTPWGRIFVGLLLAQGLYHGLQQLCTAGLLAVAEDTHDVWATLFGLIVLQGLQGVGLLAGGMLAGAGQRRGILLGTVMGVWNGVILIIIDHFNARPLMTAPVGGQPLQLTAVTAYGQPLLLSAFGAVGGLLGSLIWKPLPTLAMKASKNGQGEAVKMQGRDKRTWFGGPVAWFRVLTGITITVGGAVWANGILGFVIRAMEGKLAITSRLQAELVTMEICALAVLLGSSLAGATTANGIKQGLCVGLGATAILVGIQMAGPDPSVHRMILTAASTSALALAGGWFGGQLFPPVVAAPRGKRFTVVPG